MANSLQKRKLSITGTDGIISVDYITQNLKVHGKFAQNISINKEEPLKNELRSFVNSVLEDKEPPVNGESGLYALKVVLNAIKSAKKGYPVRLEGGKMNKELIKSSRTSSQRIYNWRNSGWIKYLQRHSKMADIKGWRKS